MKPGERLAGGQESFLRRGWQELKRGARDEFMNPRRRYFADDLATATLRGGACMAGAVSPDIPWRQFDRRRTPWSMDWAFTQTRGKLILALNGGSLSQPLTISDYVEAGGADPAKSPIYVPRMPEPVVFYEAGLNEEIAKILRRTREFLAADIARQVFPSAFGGTARKEFAQSIEEDGDIDPVMRNIAQTLFRFGYEAIISFDNVQSEAEDSVRRWLCGPVSRDFYEFTESFKTWVLETGLMPDEEATRIPALFGPVRDTLRILHGCIIDKERIDPAAIALAKITVWAARNYMYVVDAGRSTSLSDLTRMFPVGGSRVGNPKGVFRLTDFRPFARPDIQPGNGDDGDDAA